MKIRHPIIIGIDTHKATHVAVAIDTQGTRLAALSIPANSKGYLELERWSCGVERQPPCPRATTTLAGFQAAEVGVFVDFLG